MSQYLEPNDDGAANLPPSTPANPRVERVRHMLYGSRSGIDRTIKILHSFGYADPNDWSDPIPTDKPHQWMVIMTKTLLLE